MYAASTDNSVNFKNNTNTPIMRDKFLADLMFRVYDEDERRNELIDTKNSQMIIFIGSILTLQSTLFISPVVEYVILNNAIDWYCKIIVYFLLIVSFISYLIAIHYFIEAYVFSDKFQSSPSPKGLLDYAKDDVSLFNVQAEVIATLKETIDENDKIINKKIIKGKKGFKWLQKACLTTFIFVLLFLLFIF